MLSLFVSISKVLMYTDAGGITTERFISCAFMDDNNRDKIKKKIKKIEFNRY